MAFTIGDLPNPSRGPELLAAAWTGTGLAIIMVALRLYTRVTHKNLGLDDLFIVVSLALVIFGSAMVTLAAQNGFGRHLDILILFDAAEIPLALKWAIFAELSAYFTTYFIKLSVCFFVFRLLAGSQERKRITWILWSLMAFMTLICIGSVVTLAIECTPFYGIWDFSAPNRQCIPFWVQPLMVKIYGAIGAATDIACVLTPVYVVRKLQMKKSIKITICALVGLGLFTAACSIAKSVTADFSTPDGTWDLVPPAIWQLLEQELGTIVACAPALRQLFIPRKANSRPSKGYSEKKNSGNKRSFGSGPKRTGGSSGKTTNISNGTNTSDGDTIFAMGDIEAGILTKPDEVLEDRNQEERVVEVSEDDDSWDRSSSDQSLIARPLNASESIKRREPRNDTRNKEPATRNSRFGGSPTATTIRSSFSPRTGQHMFEGLPQNVQNLNRKPSEEMVGEPGVVLPSLSDYISPWEPRSAPIPTSQPSYTLSPAQKGPKTAHLPLSTFNSSIQSLNHNGIRGPVPKLKIRPPSDASLVKRPTEPRGAAYEPLLERFEEVNLKTERPKHAAISTYSSQQSLKVPQISRLPPGHPARSPSPTRYIDKPLPPLPH